MSDQIVLEKQELPAGNPTGAAVKTGDGSGACSVQGKGWSKGARGLALCCGAPILLIAAVSFFGLSLGAIASGALSDITLLACPVGMFLIMRMTMKDKKED